MQNKERKKLHNLVIFKMNKRICFRSMISQITIYVQKWAR